MDRGWKEINQGGDIRVPNIYRFIIKFITPVLLLFVFIGSLVTPVGNDWLAAKASLLAGNGWPLDNSSLIRQITNSGLKEQIAAATDPAIIHQLNEKLFYVTAARVLLLSTFVAICVLVFIAYRKRLKHHYA